MKRIIFVLAVCFSVNVLAQTFSVSQLKGCGWVDDTFRDDVIKTIWFTDTICYDKDDFLTIGKSATIAPPYYLSDSMVRDFNAANVGKSTTGKYLIINQGNEKYGYAMTIWEILGISEEKLVVKCGLYYSDTGKSGPYVRTFRKVKGKQSR